MNKLFSCGALFLAAASTTTTAHAGSEPSDETSGVSLTGNVTLTTDYQWRGETQSNHDFAIQGGFDLTTDTGFYAGVWASTVDFDDESDTNVEVDFYGGYAGEFGPHIGFDVGVISYQYPDADGENNDFYEIYAGLDKHLGDNLHVHGKVYYDPDSEYMFVHSEAVYAFTEHFTADVGLGKYLEGHHEVYDYHIGATYSLNGFDLDLRYYAVEDKDTSHDLHYNVYDSHHSEEKKDNDNVVFSISRSF